jgi:glycosyltransferase involved in cell wall biosynthesis
MELAMAGVIRQLSSPDMRHSIICLKGEPLIAEKLPGEVEVHCLHSRPNELQLPWRLRQLIGQIKPNVIHARNWGAWPDVALARLLSLRPVPLIFSFHGFASFPVPLRRKLAFRGLCRVTTHLVTVSDSSKQMLAHEMGWPVSRVQVIPNGVDTSRELPAAWSWAQPAA